MNDKASLTISFDGASDANANEYANELEALALRLGGDEVQVRRDKSDPTRMDLGVVLTVILSSGATLALARGVADWLRKRSTAKITIRDERNQIIAEGLTSADAVRLAQQGFSQHKS